MSDSQNNFPSRGPVVARQGPGPHVLLHVKVQPRASRNEIAGTLGSELKVKVTAPPVDSAANEALVRFLAEHLEIPRSAVQIVRGENARHKTIAIRGLTAEEVERKLLIS